MPRIKFNLTQTSEVRMSETKTEERYHYQSEDGQWHTVFNAGDEPWTWDTIGNMSQPMVEKLIDRCCELGFKPEAIKEVEIEA